MQWRKWRRVPLPVMYQSSDNHHLHSMGSSLPSKQVFMNKQICEQILNRQLFWVRYFGFAIKVPLDGSQKLLENSITKKICQISILNYYILYTPPKNVWGGLFLAGNRNNLCLIWIGMKQKKIFLKTKLRYSKPPILNTFLPKFQALVLGLG